MDIKKTIQECGIDEQSTHKILMLYKTAKSTCRELATNGLKSIFEAGSLNN